MVELPQVEQEVYGLDCPILCRFVQWGSVIILPHIYVYTMLDSAEAQLKQHMYGVYCMDSTFPYHVAPATECSEVEWRQWPSSSAFSSAR